MAGRRRSGAQGVTRPTIEATEFGNSVDAGEVGDATAAALDADAGDGVAIALEGDAGFGAVAGGARRIGGIGEEVLEGGFDGGVRGGPGIDGCEHGFARQGPGGREGDK